jgi:hypothetical protein
MQKFSFYSISSDTAMIIFKNWSWLFLIFDLLKSNGAYIQLFRTEDGSGVQLYDCLYYTNTTAANNESTPYCIRTKESITLNRSFSCANSSEEWTFKRLKEMNVSQEEILMWNSSNEMVDRYGAYLRTGYV